MISSMGGWPQVFGCCFWICESQQSLEEKASNGQTSAADVQGDMKKWFGWCWMVEWLRALIKIFGNISNKTIPAPNFPVLGAQSRIGRFHRATWWMFSQSCQEVSMDIVGRLEAVCKPLQSCAKENLLMCGGSKQVVEILGWMATLLKHA